MFDAFLKINGIVGESSDEAHKVWIEILGFSWGVSQPMGGASGHGGGRSTGRACFQKLRVTMEKGSVPVGFDGLSEKRCDPGPFYPATFWRIKSAPVWRAWPVELPTG